MKVDVSRLSQRMDQLYEFDREPVDSENLKSGTHFAGLFAGEHVAATEFVIGAFFVLHGVAFYELVAGLLIGNLLAVLSWAFICAPIATQTRLTLYWYLKKILGPHLTFVYNLANAVLYCVLAGAMIAVAATAVGITFGLPIPGLDAVFPSSVWWVVITFAVGAVITTFAILGFEKVSQFSTLCSPWVFVVFIAGAIASLSSLGVDPNLDNLLTVAQTGIWNGVAEPGQEAYNLWHVMFFAWIANLAMHIGLSDMALFRYAKNWKYGFYSAFGMYLGHMLAWMCSGVMVAAVAREMSPGLMAFEAAGLAGAAAVVLAGWTTANPTLYRAGLALQTITPNWPRWKVTLVAGTLTTVLACFPIIFLELLDYVAIYGLLLMPVGAIVFAEHWLLPEAPAVEGPYSDRAFNWQAALIWGGTLLVCFLLPIHLYFRWLPGYLLAIAGYTVLRKAFGYSRVPRAAVKPPSN